MNNCTNTILFLGRSVAPEIYVYPIITNLLGGLYLVGHGRSRRNGAEGAWVGRFGRYFWLISQIGFKKIETSASLN